LKVYGGLLHLEGKSRIGVAVSGGADSVFLLHALTNLGVAVAVLHVNHRLRAAESDADEAFVRELAASLSLPVRALVQPVAPGNVEQEARRARYRFFAECIAERICDAVATGHTLDDQAETVLSRFLRGAGTAGLSAIRPVTANHLVRPLLGLRRDDIRNSLRERGIAWREDQSNANPDYQRNRIRHEVLPSLLALNPSLPEVLASTAEWARGEEDYWACEIARLAPDLLQCAGEAVLIRTVALNELATAVQRRLLRKGIEIVRGSLRSVDFFHIEAIRTLAASTEGSGRIQLPGLDVYRSFDWLRLAPIGIDSRLERDFEAELKVPGRTTLPERLLTIDMELTPVADVYNNQRNTLDWGPCAGALKLRNWRPGDAYRPAWKSGAEKIKTLFQEFRVPLWERRTWPVITLTGAAQPDKILWTRRFGASFEFAARPESGQILTIHDAGESNRVDSASKIQGAVNADRCEREAGRL
jgi:tRNA(Ile)-lysidine synthase